VSGRTPLNPHMLLKVAIASRSISFHPVGTICNPCVELILSAVQKQSHWAMRQISTHLVFFSFLK